MLLRKRESNGSRDRVTSLPVSVKGQSFLGPQTSGSSSCSLLGLVRGVRAAQGSRDDNGATRQGVGGGVALSLIHRPVATRSQTSVMMSACAADACWASFYLRRIMR